MDAAPETRSVEVSTGLSEISGNNVEAIKDSFAHEAVAKGQFDSPEAAHEAVATRESEVAEEHGLTVNMSASSLDRFLTVGKLETAWDYARESDSTEQSLGTLAVLNGKDMSGGYEEVRHVAEEGLRQYAPTDAPRHEPVYAALAGPRERETGAAPAYGKFWIELDDSLAGRGVYIFSDSLASVSETEAGHLAFDNSSVLSADDAVTGKAVTDLVEDYHDSLGLHMVGSFAQNANPDDLMTVAGRRPGYVEGAIFDDVTADKVRIGAALDTVDDLPGAGQVFRNHPERMEQAHVYCKETINGVVVDWLAEQATVSVGGAEYDPQRASGLWEQLEVTPDASYQEVGEALKKQAILTYRDIVTSGLSVPRIRNYEDSVQWDTYIKSMRADAKNAPPAVSEKIGTLIELQQARTFFENTQPQVVEQTPGGVEGVAA